MSPSSPIPPVSIAGTSPLVERIAAFPVDEPVAYQLADGPAQQLAEVDVLRARLAAVEALVVKAAENGITTIDRVLVARAAEGGER
ncbi:hypothetical protein [Streptomyces sp. URMC 124]|uniref:hypothetical protein n=1 Tax=Streptomyces sp. URMC 124 TaxID=3423405 RepID=UPI003F1D8991